MGEVFFQPSTPLTPPECQPTLHAPVFVDQLRSPESIPSLAGRYVRSYWAARLQRLVESIPGLHKRLQIRVLYLILSSSCEEGYSSGGGGIRDQIRRMGLPTWFLLVFLLRARTTLNTSLLAAFLMSMIKIKKRNFKHLRLIYKAHYSKMKE